MKGRGIALTLLLFGAAVPIALGGGVDETSRFSVNSAPFVGAPPQIDGVVGKREWEGAALLPNLIHTQKGLAADTQARMYLAHDDQALYVAFQIERTDKARAPSEADEIEVVLDAGHDHKTLITFRGNIAAQIAPANVTWQYKARAVPRFGWEGEIAIPFASLNRKAPVAGEVWGFDFINRQRSPFEETTAYSFGKELSHVVFLRDVPAVKFLQAGTFFGESGGGAVVEIPNPSERPVNLNVALELLRRRSDAKGSYLPNVAGGITDSPDIIMPSSRQDLINGELAKYEAVPTAMTNKTITVAAKRREELRVAESQPAEYLLKYRVAREDQTISAGLLPYRLMPPMQMTLRPYFLQQQIVEAKIDLRKAKDWDAGATAKVTIVKQAGDAPLATVEHAFVTDEREFAAALPIDKLGEGGYLVTLELLGADGKSRGTISEGFHKPATPKWMSDRAGLEPAIPEPWVPIRADAREASFLMGAYQFADSLFPAQASVRSIYDEKRAPLLTAPIALTGKVNGREIAWGKTAAKLDEAKPDLVRYSAQTQFENLTASATTEFEYDGMAKVKLKLAPAAGQKPAIDHLALEIPLAKEFATLCLHGASASEVWKGVLEKDRNAGAVPAEGIRCEFVHSFWLGNEERGFTWFAENTKGWHVDANGVKQAIEILPTKSGTVLRINLFKGEKPFTLEKERELVFGFMFTPSRRPRVKPIHHGTNHERLAEIGGTRMNNVEAWMYPLQGTPTLTNERIHELRKKHGDAYAQIGFWPALTPDEMRALVGAARKAGLTFTPYTAWGIHNHWDVYLTFGEEMIADPLTGMGCGANAGCWNTPFQDAFTAGLRDRVGDLDIDGYRTDAGFFADRCDNLRHDAYGSECGWIDDDGKVQPSRNLFSARRMAQRAYRLFHGGAKKDGLCIKHMYYGTRYDLILGHTDATMSVEGAEMKAASLKEFPLDFYRANVMGDPHGWQTIYMAKADRVGYDARLGICLLHNLNPRGGHDMMRGLTSSYSRSANLGTATPVWAAREWIKPYEKGMELWGYWKNAKVLDTGNADIKGTIYLRRGEKMLVGLLNLDRKPVATDVRIDLKSLGFGGKVFAYDPMLREEVLIEGGALKLAFTPEGCRLIQIAATPFDVYVPEKIGANLVAEINDGMTPDWQAAQYVDERQPQPPTSNDLRFEGSALVIQGTGENIVGLRKTLSNSTQPGKSYMLEAELHVDAGDGSFLGEKVDISYFWVSCGETASYNHDFRVYGAQMPPDHFEKVRLYFTRGEAPLMVDLKMNRAGGKATMKNISLHELGTAPAWCKRGT